MKAQIWTIENCPYCIKAKKLLEHKGLKYKEMQGFHPDWPTVPYIIVDGKGVGGLAELARYVRTF